MASILPALLLSGACACTSLDPRPRPVTSPAATVLGPSDGQGCLALQRIREVRVRDDWTIDFFTVDGGVLRNALPRRCAGLGSRGAITYDTATGQLCRTDPVYVLRQEGGRVERGAGCALGTFVAVRLETD